MFSSTMDHGCSTWLTLATTFQLHRTTPQQPAWRWWGSLRWWSADDRRGTLRACHRDSDRDESDGSFSTYIYIYLGHPWNTFSCPDPQKLSFHSLWRFSCPRSKVHALSDSRTVFHVLLAKLRSNYVHIAFELRSNYVQLRSSCAKITYNVIVWKCFMKSRPGQQFLSNFPIVCFFSSGQEKVSWGCPRYIYIYVNAYYIFYTAHAYRMLLEALQNTGYDDRWWAQGGTIVNMSLSLSPVL